MTPAGLMTWGLMTAQPKLRSVTQIMATARNLPAEAQVPAKQLDPGTTEVVNALFKELQAIFPAWKQAWPDDEALKAAKRSWIKSRRRGHQHARADPLRHPEVPGAGYRLRPEQRKVHQAVPADAGGNGHSAACEGPGRGAGELPPQQGGFPHRSHAAVRHAALQCEAQNLGSMEVERAEKVFARAYDITIRMLVAGEPLGEIATGIGHDSQKSAAQLADEHASQRQVRLLEVQQIPTSAAQCRASLLAKLNIKRAGQPAGEGCEQT